MIKQNSKFLLVLLLTALIFVGCGSSGGSSDAGTSNLQNLDIEGEWQYVATTDGCDKKEIGHIVIKKVDADTFQGYMYSSNGLEKDCTYSGEYRVPSSGWAYYNGKLTDISLADFQNYIASITGDLVNSVTFNSASKITMNGDFLTIFTRNDSSFNGNSYSGRYTFTSGSFANCDAGGTVDVLIKNDKVNGIVTDYYGGSVTVDGLSISNGKYSGTASDGTIWSGVIRTDGFEGTYRNSQWNCNGTFEGINKN